MRGFTFKLLALNILAVSLLACVGARAGDSFAGDYDSADLSIRITAATDGYTGEIQKGNRHFPIKARQEAGRLSGVFSSPDGDFKFTASRTNDGLTLVSGSATFVLKAHSPAVDPLPAAKADPRADRERNEAAIPAGYTVVATTEFGKALTAEKPDADSVTAAFQATFPDLAGYFDAKPVIAGVFEDVKDHLSGGASFTATLRGRTFNGFVSCKLKKKGAAVAVVYCRSDAPKTAWAALVAKPNPDRQRPAAEIKLHEYEFPDGTGTVGVAEGWQTNSPSLMTGVMIKGPAGQEVNLAFGASISTPDGPLVQMHNQLVANARQFGMPPPEPLPVTIMIAPYSDPATALKALAPQFSRISQSIGGPGISLDQIVSVQKVGTTIPNGQAALIVFDQTRTVRGNATHYRSGMRWDMGPVGPGAWMLYTSEVLAPAERYERDLPAMLAMAVSLKENPRVIMEKTRINIEAANARFAAMQQANKELQDAFDAQHRSWEHNELVQSRSFADFDETIIGYRTVEDTSTGNRASVDLGNVHEIVNHLNEYDPGRYKEIPLRDEMYPLPGR